MSPARGTKRRTGRRRVSKRAAPAPARRRAPKTDKDETSSTEWQPSPHDRSAARKGVLELTWMRFDALVGELARTVKVVRPEAVVGVAHGGVFVGGAMARALSCDFFPVRITRRSRDTGTRHAPRMTGKMPPELRGKRVVIVDDVSASGDTLELARGLAKKVGAREVLTAVLLRRTHGYAPDFAALTSDELTVFPWDYQPLVEEGRFPPG